MCIISKRLRNQGCGSGFSESGSGSTHFAESECWSRLLMNLDLIRIQSGSEPKFLTVNFGENYKRKFFFFIKKRHICLLKPFQAPGETSSHTEISSNKKPLRFFIFWETIVACLDLPSLTQLNPDPIQIRIRIQNAVWHVKVFKCDDKKSARWKNERYITWKESISSRHY